MTEPAPWAWPPWAATLDPRDRRPATARHLASGAAAQGHVKIGPTLTDKLKNIMNILIGKLPAST